MVEYTNVLFCEIIIIVSPLKQQQQHNNNNKKQNKTKQNKTKQQQQQKPNTNDKNQKGLTTLTQNKFVSDTRGCHDAGRCFIVDESGPVVCFMGAR